LSNIVGREKGAMLKSQLFVLLFLIVMVSPGTKSFATEWCSQYFKSMEYDKAIEECTIAINSGDNNRENLFEYYATRGLVYKIQGKYDEALSDYNNAVNLGTDNGKLSFTYSDRGNLYERKGLYDKAISDYSKAIELNPASYVGTYNISRLFALMNDAESSCKWLRKSIENGFSIGKKVVKKEKPFNNIRDSRCYKEIMDRE
jgi:tetratricopeptide (TPR) repeat protein